MIVKLENYTNERGMLLAERIMVDPTNKTLFDRFTGTCMIGIQTPQGTHGQQIDFPIKADSIQEAFNKFEDSAKAFVEQMKREAGKKIIRAAADSVPSRIIQP